ncbi:DUF7344 domain-containing protein [Halobaculum lipolyticum]|uniref:ArsR family transcriptional regulator n=1 Tax=Halobaculum lipolyticum TaxID=3032001 RepID=A0ABD5WD59_9EURY|nr:hypothetical protein [Halobaculum sp. DT31]
MQPQRHTGSLGEYFTVLANGHRRRLLVALMRSNPRDEESLRAEIAVDDLTDEDEEVLRYKLHHVHLPKLDEMAFVTWDRERDVITRGPRFDEIRPLLRLMEDHADELPDDWP